MSETSSRPYRKLHLPLGSRCELITQHPNGVWRVYLAINDKNIPIHRALGTFIELHPDGHAVMNTIRPDSEEDYVCLPIAKDQS